MNWTEGNLARHSRGKAKNEVLKHQKQNFAKARNKLLNSSTKRVPMPISFLTSDRAEELGKSPIFRSSNLSQRGRGISPGHTTLLRSEASARHDGGDLSWKNRDYDSNDMSIRPTGVRKHHLLADIVDEETRIDRDKRQRLLKKPDWAGLTISEPLNLSFQDTTQTPSGRRWSKLKRSEQRAGPNPRDFASSRHAKLISRSQLTSRTMSQESKPHSIRIQIGSQGPGTVTSSNSQASNKSYGFVSPTSPSRSPTYASLTQRACYRHGQAREPRQEALIPKVYHENPALVQHIRSPMWPERHDINRGSSTKNPYHEEPSRIAYASSIIHEPAPHRADYFSVLHWSQSPSSNDSASIHVEVDNPKLKPAPSEIADNEKWMALARSSDNNIIPLTRGSSLCDSSSFRPTISPGISGMQSQPGLSPAESFGLPTTSSTSKQMQDHLVNVHLGSNEFLGSTLQPTCPKETPETLPTGYMHISNPSLLKHRIISTEENTHTRHLGMQPDEDDSMVWKNFVLENDSDQLEDRAFKEAAHKAAQELRPSDTPTSSRDWPSPHDGFQDGVTTATMDSTQPKMQEVRSDDMTSLCTTNESHVATYASSSSSPVARCASGLETMGMPESSISTDLKHHDNTASSASRSTISTPMAVSSDADTEGFSKEDASSTCATKGSQSSFQFSMPRTFIGKFAQSGLPINAPQLPLGKVKGKGLNTKPGCKRKRRDGRMDIRDFPDFDGDPIEEYDED